MSIYATLGEIAVRRFGDQHFVELLIQSVPAHIDYVGPAWDFLPAPADPEGNTPRAVLFVEPGEDKGTHRNGQEYVRPLLVLTGAEYESIGFATLLRQLEESLDRRYGERPTATYISPEGSRRNLFPPKQN